MIILILQLTAVKWEQDIDFHQLFLIHQVCTDLWRNLYASNLALKGTSGHSGAQTSLFHWNWRSLDVLKFKYLWKARWNLT